MPDEKQIASFYPDEYMVYEDVKPKSISNMEKSVLKNKFVNRQNGPRANCRNQSVISSYNRLIDSLFYKAADLSKSDFFQGYRDGVIRTNTAAFIAIFAQKLCDHRPAVLHPNGTVRTYFHAQRFR